MASSCQLAATLDSHQISTGFASVANNAVDSVFPGFTVRYLGADARVVLNALSAVTDVRLVSTPKLLVLANQTAKLQVGNEVPIITQTSSGTDTTSRIINTVIYRDTGVVLTVLPRVGDHGRIFIDIQQEVSDVTPTTSSTIDSPTIQQRKFSTQVQVEDGQVISLGGLISSAVTKSVSGIPYLSRAPVIGALFRNRNDTTKQTELVVFLKPRLVQSRADADLVTDEVAQRLRALGFSHARP